jgi:peptide/nickel transport system permease protein
MVNFLIRRLIQMAIVLFFASVVSYLLLDVSPGGPLLRFQQQQQGGADRITEEDLARLRARYELDIYVPYRFTRWFVGWPAGPVEIFGNEYLSDLQVGCAIPQVEEFVLRDVETGEIVGTETVDSGCKRPVTLADLEDRRVSDGVLFGDFGLSQQILRDRPISELIASRLPYTLALMGGSTLLALVVAIPIGIYSAVKQYSVFDYVMTTSAFIGSSLPTFFFGIMAILLFSVLPESAGLPYLPSGNATANRDYVIPLLGEVTAASPLDYVLHFIMPCAVLSFVSIAGWSRFIRSSMLEVLRQDYVKTARAKGVREWLVITRHAFRNALIPFITLLAGILPILFAGAAITEQVFNWPGLGTLLINALSVSDYTVVMALLYITIVLQLIGYIISDLLYTFADPRIRLS